MKLARYEHHGFPHLGVIRGDMIHHLQTDLDALGVLALPLSERNLLEATAGRWHRAPVSEIRLLPPVEPRAMRDFVTFESHIEGMKRSEPGDGLVPPAWYEAPAFLFMNPWSLIGAHDDLPCPPGTKALDFELELAAIVGRTVRDVDPTEAGDAIVGYAILNDWSSRDVQRREMSVGLGPSKGKDFASTLGPWITTPDELEAFRVDGRLDLEMAVEVNGRVVGRDRSGSMGWSFEQLLAHAARGATVGAGDVLASGTCGGGALAEIWSRTGRQDPPPLQEGDIVTMTIEALGSISNQVVAPARTSDPVAPARRKADVS